MPNKDDKNNTNIGNKLSFISENEVPDDILKDVEASLTMNPYVRWAKFIMTDDQPNGNRQRTPLSEFDNIIKSGIYMPIKMGEGKIEEGHEDSSPIGVITHLKKEFVEGINRIVGLAALWIRERPSDVSYLKERIDNNEDVNVSWELGASDMVLAPDGIFDWIGLAVQAVTVVDRPAYLGRTKITAMAAKKSAPAKWSDDYIKNLPDTSFLFIERGGSKDSEGRTSQEQRHFPVKDDKGLYDESKLREVLTEAGKMKNLPTPILKSLKKTVTTLLERIDAGASLEEISGITTIAPLENINTEDDTVELEQLKLRVTELEAKLATAEAALNQTKADLTVANDAKAALDTEKVALDTELTELRNFKKEIDDEVAKVEKLDGIKTKFAEAKLEKDPAYFTENAEKLLKLDEAGLEFMLQEFTAFSNKDAQASLTIPNLTGEGADKVSTSELVKAFKELHKERKSK